MNRLIVIGNGFDLAHGINTSFNDFITNYFCDVMNLFYSSSYTHSDPLLKISFKGNHHFVPPKPITKENVYQVINHFKESRFINFEFESRLLENAYLRASTLQWVDLEVMYFDTLLAVKHGYKNNNQKDEIQKVNSQLDYLKFKLVEYLQKQESIFTNGFDTRPLIDCFCEEINKDEIVTLSLEKNILPDNLYFLNFNYTNTVEDYLKLCNKSIPSQQNYIHGCLSGVNGNPIFGFGDEFDKKYLEFEDEKNKELFKHIKSFEYLQTKNFYLLTRFIESNDFQVHIYGHSCGISDRTMLNQIFEHSNCKSIKIFYYKIDEDRNDFTDKTYEISSHFKDKTMLRKKLVPFDLSREMPQPKV